MASDPASRCLTQLFEAQVRRTPQQPAVRCSDQQVTYRQLNERANQLAHYLQRQAVGPEVLVGLCLERSVEMVVGLLAILKAGGAYVPLDPAFPPERLAFMLQDAQAPVLLTRRGLLPERLVAGRQVVCLDSDGAAMARESPEDPLCEATAENLAYVIYTSGSTGKPKGVQIPHRAVVNFLASMQEQPGLTARDTLLATTTLSFDIAGLELWLPLVVGACVVVLRKEATADGAQLAQWLAKSGATVMQATPATWRLLLHAGWRGDRQLKVLCGGEALSRELAEQLLARSASLWNLYGPTETTIWSALQRLQPGAGPVVIGRPIANTQMHLLDPQGQPVPAGVAGELHIGGAGLARGYRQRPGVTAEKFIPNPWSSEPGARLYRTGDLARRLPDGTLECLGRIDHQVKIRGYRIELGEIEAVLGQHPALREAVVLAREDVPGEKRLVAYVVPANGEAFTNRELRRFLKEQLPDYMVPAAFVRLAALPLTPNGKVNRLALPAPDPHRPELEGAFLAPRDRIEASLAQIWEQVLGIRPLGVRDNIFELGVDSLTAARLFAAIEKSFGKRLPPAPLFRAPTMEQLADLLRQKGDSRGWTSLVPIQPHGSKPPLFCVHGGAGTILLFHDLARRLGPDQPVYGLQQRGLYGKDAPHSRVEEMATHYLKEMRTVQPAGPYYLAGYCFGAIVVFEMAQQLQRQGEEVALLATFNGPSPDFIRRGYQAPVRPKLSDNASGGSNPPGPRGQRNWFAALVRSTRNFLYRWAGILRWQVRMRFYLVTRLSLPERMRDTFFLHINSRAELRYVPEVYPGRMILFRAQGFYREPCDPYLGWGGLLAEGIEAYEIPGPHPTNRDIMKEPCIAAVAEQLKEHLPRTEGPSAAGLREEQAVSR